MYIMTKRTKIIVLCGTLLLVSVLSTGIFITKRNSVVKRDTGTKNNTQSHSTYKLNLLTGDKYSSQQPNTLTFRIEDQESVVLKDFDTVHERLLHLIIIRKDISNFQHLHPSFDTIKGEFSIDRVNISSDGDYRIYADFTPSNSQIGPRGEKLAATPNVDVTVGSTSAYVPELVTKEKLVSSANGLDTALFFTPNEDSPGGKPNTTFTAGQDSTVAIELNKNGNAYTELEPYLGSLGHMIVIGPKLEFIHAHPLTESMSNQSGLVSFSILFPEAGLYKLFMQTQTNGQINTTDYVLDIKPGTASIDNQDSGAIQQTH